MTDLITVPAPAVWHCDQCGARYDAAGSCTNDHPAVTLQQLPATDTPPADSATTAAITTPSLLGIDAASPPLANLLPASDTVAVPTPLHEAQAALVGAQESLAHAISILGEHLS